jgi:DNA-binding NarL/FixJ family response regulator
MGKRKTMEKHQGNERSVCSHAGVAMRQQSRAVAFDLDAASLMSLRAALPGWEIKVVNGATAASLHDEWDPAAADFLVVKARKKAAESLRLCRFLVFRGVFSTDFREGRAEAARLRQGRQDQARRADAPLLVLVPSGQEPLVRAALEAGADGCLVMPVHAKEMASMLARVQQGNQPGRHTLNLDQAQCENRWQDDGGQG